MKITWNLIPSDPTVQQKLKERFILIQKPFKKAITFITLFLLTGIQINYFVNERWTNPA
jgi:hypothetical protein